MKFVQLLKYRAAFYVRIISSRFCADAQSLMLIVVLIVGSA